MMSTVGGSSSSSFYTTATTTSSVGAFPGDSTSFNPNANGAGENAIQSWWESISRARTRIQILVSLLPFSTSSTTVIAAFVDFDRLAHSLLDSSVAYAAISEVLWGPLSRSSDDSLCQWLYETFQSFDSDLRLITLSFLLSLTASSPILLASSPSSVVLLASARMLFSTNQRLIWGRWQARRKKKSMSE